MQVTLHFNACVAIIDTWLEYNLLISGIVHVD